MNVPAASSSYSAWEGWKEVGQRWRVYGWMCSELLLNCRLTMHHARWLAGLPVVARTHS